MSLASRNKCRARRPYIPVSKAAACGVLPSQPSLSMEKEPWTQRPKPERYFRSCQKQGKSIYLAAAVDGTRLNGSLCVSAEATTPLTAEFCSTRVALRSNHGFCLPFYLRRDEPAIFPSIPYAQSKRIEANIRSSFDCYRGSKPAFAQTPKSHHQNMKSRRSDLLRSDV